MVPKLKTKDSGGKNEENQKNLRSKVLITKFLIETNRHLLLIMSGFGFDAHIFGQVFDQICDQGFDQGLGEGKNH